MKNTPIVKLGVVVGSTDWLPAELAEESRRKLMERYRELFGEDSVYECPVCVTDNEANVKRALRDLAKAECTALCIYFANYGPESAGTLLAQEFGGPVMLMAAAEDGPGPYLRGRKDALSGFINACYVLKLRGVRAYIPHAPVGTLEQCAQMLHDYLPIARTLLAVRELKLISFGPRPSSYLASCAPNQLLYRLGIELSEYSELELLDAFKKHEGDRRIEKTAAEMASELGRGDRPELLQTLAQYELTLEDWIRGHKGSRSYITMTGTCWPAFPGNFGFVPCYVHSRLTGKGIPVACEVDAFGAVSEYIGQCVTSGTVTILNFNNNIPEQVYDEAIRGRVFNGKTYRQSDLFLGYHCGVTCRERLTGCSLEPHFVNRQLIGEAQSQGALYGQIAPGPVTLLRIQGTAEGLRAYVVQGQVLPVPVDTYGAYGVIAVPELERFFRNVVLERGFPNHCAVLFGHCGKTLVSVLQQLGIGDIAFNQPENVPYPGENAYAGREDWF